MSKIEKYAAEHVGKMSNGALAKALRQQAWSVNEVAQALYYSDGADLSLNNVAKALLSSDGLDLGVTDVAAALMEGLEIEPASVAEVLLAVSPPGVDSEIVATAIAQTLEDQLTSDKSLSEQGRYRRIAETLATIGIGSEQIAAALYSVDQRISCVVDALYAVDGADLDAGKVAKGILSLPDAAYGDISIDDIVEAMHDVGIDAEDIAKALKGRKGLASALLATDFVAADDEHGLNINVVANALRRGAKMSSSEVAAALLFDGFESVESVAEALYGGNGLNLSETNTVRSLHQAMLELNWTSTDASRAIADAAFSALDWSPGQIMNVWMESGLPDPDPLPDWWPQTEGENDPIDIPDDLDVRPSLPEFARARKFKREHPEIQEIKDLPEHLRRKLPGKGLIDKLQGAVSHEVGGGEVSFAVGSWNQYRGLQTMWKDRKNYAFICYLKGHDTPPEYAVHPHIDGGLTLSWVRFGAKEADVLWVDEVQSDIHDDPLLRPFQSMAMKVVFRAFIAWAFDAGFREIQMPNSREMVDKYGDQREMILFYDKAKNFGFSQADLVGYRDVSVKGYKLNPVRIPVRRR